VFPKDSGKIRLNILNLDRLKVFNSIKADKQITQNINMAMDGNTDNFEKRVLSTLYIAVKTIHGRARFNVIVFKGFKSFDFKTLNLFKKYPKKNH
jgi:hypothetical protein